MLKYVIFNLKTTLCLKTLAVYNQSLWVFRTGQLDNNQFFVVINDLIESTLLHLYYCPKNQFKNDFFLMVSTTISTPATLSLYAH